MYQIGIFDSQPIYLEGIKQIIQHEPFVISCSEIQREQAYVKITPDLNIFIYGLNQYIPVEEDILLEKCKEAYIPVLILSDQLELEVIQNYFIQGVKGLITKELADIQLIDAIRAILEENKYLDTYFNVSALSVFDNDVIEKIIQPNPSSKLTKKECEVLGCLLNGYSYRQTAKVMNLSEAMISKYRQILQKKLNVHSQSELLKKAQQLGIINFHKP